MMTGYRGEPGRVTSSVAGPNSLYVNMSYKEDKDDLGYWVGKAHYGITVLDNDESTLEDGEARTWGGKAFVIVRYPEFDCVTGDGGYRRIFGYGCGSYDDSGEFLPSRTKLSSKRMKRSPSRLFSLRKSEATGRRMLPGTLR